MLLQRTFALALRRAAAPRAAVSFAAKRTLATTPIRRDIKKEVERKVKTFSEIKTEEDLIGPGAAPGTIPTDFEQATGLERLEILGKMEGVDVFDMKPLDASRRGTMENPIVVQSFGEERYLGCTGYPADSHNTIWLTVSKDRPIERCPECGGVYKMEYVGAEASHDHHHDEHHTEHVDPPTMADFVKPQYW
ncbi:cytochrome c oxidase subunit VB [Morchella snyderi]|nr:cytochrome c oxidase subunit VB [Morchella snyderi]